MTETTIAPASEIVKRLAIIAGELAKAGIGKNRKNAQQGFNFRGVDDVYGALSPLLADNGVVITPHVLSREKTEHTTKSGGAIYSVSVTVRYVLHASDGSQLDCVVCGEAMDTGDKATTKALSGAYKYMAFQVFCIPVEGQEDADATTPEPTETLLGRVRMAIASSRNDAELAAAGELAKNCSAQDRDKLRREFAVRRAQLLKSAPKTTARPAPAQRPEQGEAELPIDPPHRDDVDESLMPHDVFAVQAVGDLRPSLAGQIAFVESRKDGHWLMPDDAGGWQPPASAHDRQQLRAVAEAHFASRGWTDLGEAGKVDLDAGGARLLAEVQPAPAHALAPTKAPSEPAPAAQAPLSPHLPGWATPRELQGVIASVKDSQGRQRKVSLFTEAQIKPAKAKDGDLLFRFFPGAADKPQLMEWQQDQWVVLPVFDPLIACVRAALVVDIKARNKVCQFGESMLLAFAKERIQDQQFDDFKDLTVRSLVQLRAAMAAQQKKGSPE